MCNFSRASAKTASGRSGRIVCRYGCSGAASLIVEENEEEIFDEEVKRLRMCWVRGRMVDMSWGRVGSGDEFV